MQSTSYLRFALSEYLNLRTHVGIFEGVVIDLSRAAKPI